MKKPLTFSALAGSIAVGSLYRHFKGLNYKVVGLARHSETLEEMVVYQALYGDYSVWVRPLSMFLETIEHENMIQPRFSLIEKTS